MEANPRIRAVATVVFLGITFASCELPQGRHQAGPAPEIAFSGKIPLDTRGPPASLQQTATVSYWPHTDTYVAGPSYEPGVVLQFDRTGRFVRTFGAEGEGPGELAVRAPVMSIYPREGVLWVMVPGAPRMTGFPADPDQDVIVLSPQRMFGRFVPLPSGGFIANGRGPGTPPLIHITDDGAVTGLSTGDLSQYSTDSTGYRVLGPSRGGGIWYGAQSPYRFFALSAQHEVVDSLDVNRGWFEEFSGLTLVALHEDSRGHLWAYFLFDGGRERDPRGPLDSLFSSLIAVYDVEAHRLLAHHVDDRALTPVVGRPEVVHFVETGIGDIEALLQRLSFTGVGG